MNLDKRILVEVMMKTLTTSILPHWCWLEEYYFIKQVFDNALVSGPNIWKVLWRSAACRKLDKLRNHSHYYQLFCFWFHSNNSCVMGNSSLWWGIDLSALTEVSVYCILKNYCWAQQCWIISEQPPNFPLCIK